MRDPYQFNIKRQPNAAKKRTEYEPLRRGEEVSVGLAGCRKLSPEEIERATSRLPTKPPGRP